MNNAYVENEPLNMLFPPELSSEKYLWRKIRAGYVLYLKLSTPTLILYAIFNIHDAYFVIIPLLTGLVGISLFVFIKYSLYEANNERIIIPLAASLGMIGIVIPVLIPIPMLMAWKYYYSAKYNLNKYLYVYDK
jgi:predicted membrane-bound spermidine synthase